MTTLRSSITSPNRNNLGFVYSLDEVENGGFFKVKEAQYSTLTHSRSESKDISDEETNHQHFQSQRYKQSTFQIANAIVYVTQEGVNYFSDRCGLGTRRSHIRRQWPKFAPAIVLAMWLSFILGIVYSNGEISFSDISGKSPISPVNSNWWYFTITYYPLCEDVRYQAWRLFSSQFVHDGLLHIIGNSICILGYGTIFELYHPMGSIVAFLVYQVSMASGCLCFSLLWPYTGLMGASPGAYGLIGGCWALIIVHNDRLDNLVSFVLPPTMSIHLAFDIYNYLQRYSPNLGYAAHLGGIVNGFLVVLSIHILFKPVPQRRQHSKGSYCLSMTATLGWMLFVGFLLHHYIHDPLDAYIRSDLHNQGERSLPCCAQLFTYMDRNQLSKEDATNSFLCFYNGGL